MPFAKIEVLRTRTPEEVQGLIDAVYLTFREALKVPEDDKHIRFVEYRPEHFPIPPGKTDNYTIVEIRMFPGRSMEAKRNLYQGIVSRFGEFGIAPVDIAIFIDEPPLENWGFRGTPASEINLGFNLNV